MSDNDIYGPLINLAVGPSRAVEAHLKAWLDTYLSAYESDNAIDLYTIARPASWIQTNLLASYPGEDISPSIIIIARGANSTPVRQSGGYDIPMDIGIAVVTTSFESDGAREVAGTYGAAILAIMSHRRNIDGRLNGRLRVLGLSVGRSPRRGVQDARAGQDGVHRQRLEHRQAHRRSRPTRPAARRG
jgi:hypothetical protein